MAYETESWPFLQARFFGAKRLVEPRLIVIHTPEWPDSSSGAEAIARYFANLPVDSVKRPSCHICVDNDSIVQCVKDSYVANAAPGANHDGLQIELTGYANQTRAQWRDKFSLGALALTADAVAQYCLKYSIPVVRLNDLQLIDGSRGIVGHDQVSRVFKKSDHTDPGPYFPWSRFMLYVKASYLDRSP